MQVSTKKTINGNHEVSRSDAKVASQYIWYHHTATGRRNTFVQLTAHKTQGTAALWVSEVIRLNASCLKISSFHSAVFLESSVLGCDILGCDIVYSSTFIPVPEA